MGMFSSLFGSSGSDKADRLRQQAIDAFNAVSTPELSALQIELDKYVQAGTLTPQQAEVTLLNSNAFNNIKLDPALYGAQKQALQQLQDTANEGGLTAIDRAKIQDIQDTLNTTARGRNEALLQNARERGIGGSGLELTNRLMQEQSAAEQASRAGTDVAAQAQARALAALQSAGQLGGQMQAQQYGQEAQKAAAQNAIDKFNAETQTSGNLYNVQTANQAQAANLANQQAVMNANVAAENAAKQYNAQQNQLRFQDELAKAQGKAGTLNQWASDAQAQAARESGADMALTGGLLSAGTAALTAGMGGFGTPAAKGTTSVTPQFGKVYNPTAEQLGYAEGGLVPGEAEEEGDSKKNDKVPALLSPGELVVPRSVASKIPNTKTLTDEEEFEKFMKERPSKMAKGGRVLDKMQKLIQGKLPPSPQQGPAQTSGGILPKAAPAMPVAPQVTPVLPQRPQLSNRFRGFRAMAEGGEVEANESDESCVKTALQSLQRRVTNLEGGM